MDLARIKDHWDHEGSLFHSEQEWLIAEVERLQEIVDAGHDYFRYALGLPEDAPMRFDYYAGQISSSLTLSRAEGRMEGMKQAELIAEGMQGTVSMFLHAEDCTAHNVACRQIAAAIREAAQEKDNNEKKEKV